MTGIERIVNKIKEDAQAECDKTLDLARSEALRIISGARSAAKEQAAQILSEAEGQRGEAMRRAVSSAGLEVRKMRLGVKQRLLAEAFDAAVLKIKNLPSQEYRAFLIKLAKNAAEDGAELIFSPADRTAHGQAVVESLNNTLSPDVNITLSGETRDISGGVIVRKGKVEINCSLGVLTDSIRWEITPDLVKILF